MSNTSTPPSVYPHSFLQSEFWAEFKSSQGWESRCICITCGETEISIFVLLRLIRPFGVLAYIPMAPPCYCEELADSRETALSRGQALLHVSEEIKKNLPSNVFFLRFDPPWGTQTCNSGGKLVAPDIFPHTPFLLKNAASLKKSPVDIQPPNTVCLDLRLTEDALLAQCKAKWRYNIRLAEKKGVGVRCYHSDAFEEGLDIFYSLYEQTALRDGIAIHTKNYYRTLFQTAQQYTATVQLSIYCATYQDTVIAAVITLFYYNREAVYLYGASSNEHRNVMPAYILQWTAIKDAKRAGCLYYDFYGIPPSDNPNHPMYGLYRFKTGFGGVILHRVGSLDVPVKSFIYRVYRIAEIVRNFWYKKIKKRFR